MFVSSLSVPTTVQRLIAANHIGPFFVYIEEARSTFCASSCASISFFTITVLVWCRDIAVATALKEECAWLQNLSIT
jgi:hypothetical protein